jgi:hypothetical protein
LIFLLDWDIDHTAPFRGLFHGRIKSSHPEIPDN